MATDRLSPDIYDLQAEREFALDRDFERELTRSPRVALRRIVTDADRAESLRLNFISAFVGKAGGE